MHPPERVTRVTGQAFLPEAPPGLATGYALLHQVRVTVCTR